MLGIYGLIIAVIIANAVSGVESGRPAYGYFSAVAHFGGGIACGLSGLAGGAKFCDFESILVDLVDFLGRAAGGRQVFLRRGPSILAKFS